MKKVMVLVLALGAGLLSGCGDKDIETGTVMHVYPSKPREERKMLVLPDEDTGKTSYDRPWVRGCEPGDSYTIKFNQLACVRGRKSL